MRTRQNTTGVHKQYYKYHKMSNALHATIRLDGVCGCYRSYFHRRRGVRWVGKILSCDTQLNIIQVLTYCEKTDKKQSLSYRKCS